MKRFNQQRLVDLIEQTGGVKVFANKLSRYFHDQRIVGEGTVYGWVVKRSRPNVDYLPAIAHVAGLTSIDNLYEEVNQS